MLCVPSSKPFASPFLAVRTHELKVQAMRSSTWMSHSSRLRSFAGEEGKKERGAPFSHSHEAEKNPPIFRRGFSFSGGGVGFSFLRGEESGDWLTSPPSLSLSSPLPSLLPHSCGWSVSTTCGIWEGEGGFHGILHMNECFLLLSDQIANSRERNGPSRSPIGASIP